VLSTQNADNVVINVQVADGTGEDTDFSASQVKTAENAIENIVENIGNADSTTTNINLADVTPVPTTPAAIAKAIANPTFVIEIGNQNTITGQCGTGPNGTLYQACTHYYANDQGQTYYAVTTVLYSAVNSNGWAPLAIHELGIGALGEQDCVVASGNNCGNSIAAVPNSNTTATSCDKTRIKNICTKCLKNN
jgi:hypothetical protein